jgi:hypothetical protein
MMNRGLSFQHAASLVGEKHPAFKALDSLLGGALLVGSAGGSATALGLFDAKGEFVARATDLGNSLLESAHGLSRLQRTERIQAANSVLIIVAFFETLALLNDRKYFIDEDSQPADHGDWARVSTPVAELIARTIRRRVRAAFQEQDRITGSYNSRSARRAVRRQLGHDAPTLPSDKVTQILVTTSLQPNDARLGSIAHSLIEADLPLPAPHLPFETHISTVKNFYRDLATAYAEASVGVDWDTLEPDEQASYRNDLASWVSDAASRQYNDHFRRLAGASPEVAFWANAIDHQATRLQIEQIRLGLNGLTAGLREDGITGASATSDELSLIHQGALHRPVVDNDDLLVPGMTVPTLDQIYVNPEFRTVSANSTSRLELESTWQQSSRRRDIQSFLIGYLSTPLASSTPLLILGQPGSGKSVLTKVLAARLPEQEYVPIRIILREVPADDDVQSQIEASIYAATGRRLSWTDFLQATQGLTPALLFDGFDELLQTTGVTQSDYLERIAKFQVREGSLGRPCVAVVTTRTAVADRARIPHGGTTAIRLEPFSNEQVESWSEVWNESNTTFFAQNGLQELSVPAVLAQQEIARQPLLLLMLALYDADGNAIHQLAFGEQRSNLYERLLATFARRELLKADRGAHEEDLAKFTELHIQELSIAALSMFNRSRQWVLVRELDEDIAALGAPADSSERRSAKFNRTYSAGEALIGRFFFIHEARAIIGERTLGTIEFLHATFGEYLVARAIAKEVGQLIGLEKFEQHSARRSSISSDYLSALLGFSAVSSRSTILEFLRELLADYWEKDGELLQKILLGFFHESCFGRRMQTEFDSYRPQDLTWLEIAANYSLNLVTLLLLNHESVDAAKLFPASASPSREWNRHAMFIRSQVVRSAWEWLTENLVVTRTPADDGLASSLRLRSEGEAEEDLSTISRIPSYWHLGSNPIESDFEGPFVFEAGKPERFMQSNRISSDMDLDLAARCVEQLVAEVGILYATYLRTSEGELVTGTEAIIQLWLASSKRGNDDALCEAYHACIRLALMARGSGVDNYRALLVRQLAKDLPRLPGQWREQVRLELQTHPTPDDEMRTWVQLMEQSLGLRGRREAGAQT